MHLVKVCYTVPRHVNMNTGWFTGISAQQPHVQQSEPQQQLMEKTCHTQDG